MCGLFLWKIKKSTSIVNAFKKIISEGRKPNKIWIDQGSEFYNKSFTDFLKINNIDMHATFNERKSVIAYKYNNTVHRTIKMKPIILLLNTMKNQIKKTLNLRLVTM